MGDEYVRPPLSRIPGTVKLKEQHSKDLKTLSYNELLEMKDRQSKFLTFKKRLQLLPDKGKRLQESYDKLLAEIERRNDVNEAAELLSELNIASKGKTVLNNLEWHGRLLPNDGSSHVADILDSDDELEMDPLRIIAQGTMHEKQVKIIPPPASLITAADLADIAAFTAESNTPSPDSVLAGQSDISASDSAAEHPPIEADLIEIDAAKLGKQQPTTELEQHALYLIEKTEMQTVHKVREKFKPYRTTISNVHDPDKERIRKKSKHWEITAATPPLIQHKEAQMVPLAESAMLQTDYIRKVKDLREKQAEEHLAKQLRNTTIRLPEESILKTKSSFQAYRNPRTDYLIEGKQRVSEQEEVQDPSIAEKAASGINYAVYK
ncbi:uncharacterized protein LOC115624380 [Scaptodrosophila lebanonensis]|uniref:Uncharacterized protein LOC115624380 n=1 Tax=Drosophila lebanonensis TaxID=7225 RepID=A0A6J2TIT5_DROLE|nr:uncharacterized protein LOC115624380 [Scaptodrosophila lebanonensis]